MPVLALLVFVALVLGSARSYGQGYVEEKKREIPAHPWGPFHVADRILILGISYTGKTTYAAKLAKPCARVAAFDPKHDYQRFGYKEYTVAELANDPSPLEAPHFKIAIIPDEDFIEDDLESFVQLTRGAGNMVVIFEEVGDYSQEGFKSLNKMARNGRHDGIMAIYVSQFAVDIPKVVRRSATRLYSFMQEEPSDLRALEERCGEKFIASAPTEWQKGKPAIWIIPTHPSTRPSGSPHSSVPSTSGTRESSDLES